jgi:hypothetical protein
MQYILFLNKKFWEDWIVIFSFDTTRSVQKTKTKIIWGTHRQQSDLISLKSQKKKKKGDTQLGDVTSLHTFFFSK